MAQQEEVVPAGTAFFTSSNRVRRKKRRMRAAGFDRDCIDAISDGAFIVNERTRRAMRLPLGGVCTYP